MPTCAWVESVRLWVLFASESSRVEKKSSAPCLTSTAANSAARVASGRSEIRTSEWLVKFCMYLDTAEFALRLGRGSSQVNLRGCRCFFIQVNPTSGANTSGATVLTLNASARVQRGREAITCVWHIY